MKLRHWVMSAAAATSILAFADPRGAAADESSQLSQFTVFGTPSGGGSFSYPNGMYCGLYHAFMIDDDGNPYAFTPINLPDGTHTFRFITSTWFPSYDTVSLNLYLRPCCLPSDLAVTPGETATTTIGNTTYTVSGFQTVSADADLVGSCFIAPDGLGDFISEFTLTVSTVDPDSDDDGVPDSADACPGHDDNVDSDGDGTPDGCDACPIDAENDADGDGICESDDNCADVVNENQTDADGDGIGDACEPDSDNDGVIDDDDNCPLDANANQADADGDGTGDVCDADDDGDGVLDAGDSCMGTPAGAPVLGNGCSVAQQCPCNNAWKNHGAYVSCVAKATNALVAQGAITGAQKDAIQSAAGQSSCGQK